MLLIPVVEVSGLIGFLIGIVSNRLDLPPVPMMMCRMVVWSIPHPLKVMRLVGGSEPVFLGGKVLERGLSMRYRCPQRYHHRR